MSINKAEFSKLSPEEKIKRLKELEKERKKDIDEIGLLIKKSMQDMRTDTLAGKIAPEQREVNIARLFESDEKGEQLERTARQETRGSASGTYQALSQLYRDYSTLKRFYGIVSTGNELTKEQIDAVGKIGERINVAEKYITESEKTASVLTPTRAILYKLQKDTGIL